MSYEVQIDLTITCDKCKKKRYNHDREFDIYTNIEDKMDDLIELNDWLQADDGNLYCLDCQEELGL